MNALDALIPTPRLLEVDEIDLALTPKRAWEAIRHGNLATSPVVRALFAVRTIPSRIIGGEPEPLRLTADEFVSSPTQPGFQRLVDTPPRELIVGAIGKVWKPDIAFVHVDDASAFGAFDEPDYVKVAWAIRLTPLGERDTHVTFELRVDATDDDAWRKFRAYFRLIGPGSRFIRHSLLAGLAREHGTPEGQENVRWFAGDELLPDAVEQVTHGITIAATPEAIWPWLIQMGGRRAGFYSYDALDNGGRRSAREVHPELQTLTVGDVIPATPDSDDGFEVLRVEQPSALVLGGLFDPELDAQLPFADPRPKHYWHVTWAFVLEPLDAERTRLHVRARVACPTSGAMHLRWIRFAHHFMERAQLRRLAARVEGRVPRDDTRDVLQGVSGAAVMVASLLTPFLRERRSHWGLSASDAARPHPGDAFVPEPRWSWTHGVEIEASAEKVWPWVAQIGANKAGFYSYQWLENLVGCDVRNAETLHPEWEVREGDMLSLHPEMPGLAVTKVERGHYFVAEAAPDPEKVAEGRGWVAASWLFLVEPLGLTRCRVISRYRVACADDLATRLSFGPVLLEPIGFAMDRRMLLGVKERAEGAKRAARATRRVDAPQTI